MPAREKLRVFVFLEERNRVFQCLRSVVIETSWVHESLSPEILDFGDFGVADFLHGAPDLVGRQRHVEVTNV